MEPKCLAPEGRNLGNRRVYSEVWKCGHCGNAAPMEIVAYHEQMRSYDDYPGGSLEWKAGTRYELLRCLGCSNVTLRSYFWNDLTMDGSEIRHLNLYPQPHEAPLGLPKKIATALETARSVRRVEPNAYGVLLGRLLEMVCDDRNAHGTYLAAKLADLSSRGEIPQKLVDVATGLRHLRNVGAHPSLGELTTREVPILDRLCRAILEYVYSAPRIAQQAEASLDELKRGQILGGAHSASESDS